jgi:sulfur-oxidizing protein SoxX
MFKRQLFLAASMAFAATTLNAGIQVPAAVVGDGYGDIGPALTGIPGFAARGEARTLTPGTSHCVACGQVDQLAEHGFLGKAGPSPDGIGARWDEGALRGIMLRADAVFPETTEFALYGTTGFNRSGGGLDGQTNEGPVEPLLTARDIEDVAANLMTLTEC